MRKTVNRIISYILTLMMLCSAFFTLPVTATAASAELSSVEAYSQGYDYTVSEDGEVTITSYLGAGAQIVIPSYLDGMPVTAIGDYAFINKVTLNKIVIPENVKEIKLCAFAGCENLSSVILPASLETIGQSAFESCEMLAEMHIPENVNTIKQNAFANTAIESFTVSENNKYFREIDGAIYDKDVTTLYSYPSGKTEPYCIIPEGVSVIAEGAFSNCNKIKRIWLPSSLKEIGGNAFEQCSSLEFIRIPDGVQRLEFNTFSFCTELVGIMIPKGVTSINAYTFNECTSLKYVYYLGNSVEWAKIYNSGTYDSLRNAEVFYNYQPVDIEPYNVTLAAAAVEYNGKEICPEVSVGIDGKALVKDKDYVVVYRNNTEIGTAEAIVVGIGDYSGAATKTFEIKGFGKSITEASVSPLPSYVYDGTAKAPEPSVRDGSKLLTKGVDYTLGYSNNTNAGTATVKIIGKGDYCDTVSKSFTIAQRSLSQLGITLSSSSYIYSGEENRPVVTVTDGTRNLTNNVDYTVSYSNNVNVGTASVTITGKGNYKDVASRGFSVLSKSIVTATVNLSETSYIYDGKEKEPSVTIKLGSKTLSSGIDYTVSYSNNVKIGMATVNIDAKGNYTGTLSRSFVILDAKGFSWGADNWNFTNTGSYFKGQTYRKQMSADYLKELQKNLTNSEFVLVFRGTSSFEARLDSSWNGSCYGMSAVMLLSKKGYLDFADYRVGASSLYSLGTPLDNPLVKSLINYYQMLQFKEVTQQQYRTVPNRTHKENITAILSLLDKNDTAIVCFKKTGWGAHAVLAYGYEYGSFTYKGVTYQGRILICDPNLSNEYSDQRNIYFNTDTYDWTIPSYSYASVSSANGAKFMYIGADTDMINYGGCLSGGSDKYTGQSFVARVDVPIISSDRSIRKVVNEGGNYQTSSSAPGEIVEDYLYDISGESNGILGYTLYDPGSAYEISQNSFSRISLSMDYEYCDMTASSSAARAVIFDNDGIVQIKSESADFGISMVFDEDYPTDWFAISVEGKEAGTVSLEKATDGFVLNSDGYLKNIRVKVFNREADASCVFDSEYSSVFIYEVDENTIGLRVDADGDGKYETELDSEPDALVGDVNNDGLVNVKDVTAIQKYLASLIIFSDDILMRADFDGDDNVNVKDVTAVQKFLADLG